MVPLCPDDNTDFYFVYPHRQLIPVGHRQLVRLWQNTAPSRALTEAGSGHNLCRKRASPCRSARRLFWKLHCAFNSKPDGNLCWYEMRESYREGRKLFCSDTYRNITTYRTATQAKLTRIIFLQVHLLRREHWWEENLLVFPKMEHNTFFFLYFCLMHFRKSKAFLIRT